VQTVLLLILLLAGSGCALSSAEDGRVRPTLREFLGINAHYHFRPDLYQPVSSLVRSYHDMNWDVEKPGDPLTFPHCINGVNWDALYSSWQDGGFSTHLSLQFLAFGRDHPDHRTLWKDKLGWAREYGHALATHFGAGQGNGLIKSVEIGNEPGGEFDDGLYQELFRQMAAGIRGADPDFKIATCTVHVGAADKYHKSLDETFGCPELLALVDVLNVHIYATLPTEHQKHPWDRTYPEDPRSDFLSSLDRVIAWRDLHAPGKEIWVTEFGWDACSAEALTRREGAFAEFNWTGTTELEQAQYLIRASLLLSTKPVERAYIFWYNDEDSPSVHGASGITRHFEPKPAYWALVQLQELAGNFRYDKTIHSDGGKWILAFRSDDGKQLWVAWTTRRIESRLCASELPEGLAFKEVYPMQTSWRSPDPLPKNNTYKLTPEITYFLLEDSGLSRLPKASPGAKRLQ